MKTARLYDYKCGCKITLGKARTIIYVCNKHFGQILHNEPIYIENEDVIFSGEIEV